MDYSLSDISKDLEGTNEILCEINKSLKELTEETKKIRMIMEKH